MSNFSPQTGPQEGSTLIRMDSLGSGSLQRGSYGSLSSFTWLGEQAQTQFLDANRAAFEEGNGNDIIDGDHSNGCPRSIMTPLPSASYNTIRFQVIIWSVSSPDVKVGKVSVKFRVTLFWNDSTPSSAPSVLAPQNGSNHTEVNGKGPRVWVMHGRKQAYEKTIKLHEGGTRSVIDIPPVSILNADSFETIGQPEVMLLKQDTRLVRWTCMYRAKLYQDNMSVSDFPHDTHRLGIQLGILTQRHPGGRWDRRKWKLALANESDTQRSIQIPHGLLVENVKIPEFNYDKEKQLDFDLLPLNHGSIPSNRSMRNVHDTDYYLRTSIVVSRDSGYYDKNIMPLLGMLNLVAIATMCLDATNFFKRGLLAINIAFLEIGLRMTLDTRLPNVGYDIKMQRVLNRFFYSILWELMESAILKYLLDKRFCSIATSRQVDFVVSILLLINQVYLTLYYKRKNGLNENIRENEVETA